MNYFIRPSKRTITIFLVVVLFLTISFQGYTQKFTFKDMHAEDNVDSLENWLIDNPSLNEVRLKNLIKAEMSYIWKANNEKFKHLPEIEFISKKLRHRLGIAFGKFQRGLYLNSISQNEEALIYLSQAFRESEKMNDLSAQVSILCYQSLISINFSALEKNGLSKYYLSKAREVISKSKNPHDHLLYLITALSNEQFELQSNKNLAYLNKLVSEILYVYNHTPNVSYAFSWVKFMEGSFFTSLNNYKKSIEINKLILNKTAKNNYFILSKVHFQLALNYFKLNLHDLATEELIIAQKTFRKIPSNSYFPAFTETKYFRLVEILKYQRKLALHLNDIKSSNALVDSIFHYQHLDIEESNRRALLQIQYKYNYEKFKIEAQNLANEKEIVLLYQKELEKDIKIKERDIRVLRYKNDLKLSQDKFKANKLINEKRIATAKSEAIFEQNKVLTLYVVFGTFLLALTIILIFILRQLFLNEKKRNSFRDQFYTILTHDLRGSINSLNGIGKVAAHLIKNNRFDDLTKVANQLEWISCHTSLLLDNTIDWGTSQSFKMDSTPQEVDISLLMNELIESYKPAIDTKNINLCLDIPQGIQAHTNHEAVIIIVRNMIANAKANTQINGKIRIVARVLKQSKQTLIRVTNSGEPIPTNKLKFIQETFDGRQNPEVGVNGLGLGIILMSQFAKKNNSSISITSDIDNGTVVSLFV
jgi:signal transduction histidine kinase